MSVYYCPFKTPSAHRYTNEVFCDTVNCPFYDVSYSNCSLAIISKHYAKKFIKEEQVEKEREELAAAAQREREEIEKLYGYGYMSADPLSMIKLD